MRHRPLLPRLLPLLVVLSLGLLCESCTTAPASGAAPATALQTFESLYANAVTAEDLVLKTTTIALQSGLIVKTQGQRVLAVVDSVKAALDAANTAAQLGNTALSTSSLASALGPIAILSACLTAKPLTPATFDSCAAKLTPAVPL